MKTYIVGSALFVSVFVVAGSASAQTGANANAQLGIQGAASTSHAGGNVEFEWKTEEGEKGNATSSQSVKATPAEPAQAARPAQAQNTQGNDPDFVGGNAVSVAAVEVRGWDATQKKEFLATVKAEAQVRSGQDLENFARSILLKDENVEELSADEDKVVVRYRVPAKFLAIFESTLPVEVVAAKAEGELGGGVEAHFPWYKFLFTTPDEVSEASIETDVSAEVEGDLDSDLNARAAARLYTVISSILKTKHDVAISAISNTLGEN